MLLQISKYAEVFDSLATSLPQISNTAHAGLIHSYIQQRQIISFLLVGTAFINGLQSYLRGEALEEAMTLAVTAVMATITMNVMLNLLVMPDIEQGTTATPIETTSQLSPSLKKSP